MPMLERLLIFYGYPLGDANRRNYSRLTLSSTAVKGMRQLKSIYLSRVDVDKFFMQQLASTAKLTKLDFEGSRKRIYPQSFFLQINLMSDLEELGLRVNAACNVDKLLSPQQLWKLKKLNVYGLEEQQEIALRNKFACLKQVLINHSRSSPWLVDSPSYAF